MKLMRYTVETALDRKPCVLDGFALHPEGLLRPCNAGEKPTDFGDYFVKGGYAARAAIIRTRRIQNVLAAAPSVIDDWEKFKAFREPVAFQLRAAPSATKRRSSKRTLVFA